MTGIIFPAGTGVNRCGRERVEHPLHFPRRRGGEPTATTPITIAKAFSPQARG